MDALHFACCHCSARLRIRDRLYLGRQIPCPECRRPLMLTEVNGELRVTPFSDTALERVSPAQAAIGASGSRPEAPIAGAQSSGADVTKKAVRGFAGNSARIDREFLSKLITLWQREPLVAIVGVFVLCASVMVTAFLLRRDRPDEMAAVSKTASNSSSTSADVMTGNELKRPTADTASVPSKSPDIGKPETNVKSLPASGITIDADNSSPPVQNSEAVRQSAPTPLSFVESPLLPEFGSSGAIQIAESQPHAVAIELQAALDQPIELFDQPRGAQLHVVLTSVAEMAGAVVEYDSDELGPAMTKLSQPVALKLQKTTIRGILERLLEPAGLTFKVQGRAIRLISTVSPVTSTDKP